MIFYFSGTGNSLFLAEQLAARWREPLVPIHEGNIPTVPKETTRIGFVFPVYCYDVPLFVEDFIRKLSIPTGAYCYGIATYGGKAGNVLYSLGQLLEQKGSTLSYGKTIAMPDNMAVLFEHPYDLASLAPAVAMLAEYAKEIEAQLVLPDTYGLDPGVLQETKESQLEILDLLSPKEVNAEICIRCGTCASVCPRKNITLTGDTVAVGTDCVDCLACVHYCPQGAMAAGKLVVTQATQYHHPQVPAVTIARNRP